MDEQQSSQLSLPPQVKVSNRAKKTSKLRMLFISWKNFTRQVARDRALFFNIRNFIQKRLTKKSFRSLKIYYIKSLLAKHFKYKVERKLRIRLFQEWRGLTGKESIKKQRLEKLVYFISLRVGFQKVKEFIAHKKMKQRQRIKMLCYWSKQTQRKYWKFLVQNIENRIKQKDNAFKVYIFSEKRLLRAGLRAFFVNLHYKKLKRRQKMKYLKYFSRLYKKKGFSGLKQLKVHKQCRIDLKLKLEQIIVKTKIN